MKGKSMKQTSKLEFIFSTFLLLAWAALIFLFSSQASEQSAELSVSVLQVSQSAVNYWPLTIFFGITLLFLVASIWILRRDNSLQGKVRMFIVFAVLMLGLLLFLIFFLRPYYQSLALGQRNFWVLHLFFRKYAHFFIYIVLGLLVSNWLAYSGINWWKRFAISLVICILFAVSDEIHQAFVPGRSALLMDVVIDTAGSVVGIMIHSILHYLSKPRTVWQAFWNL